MSSNKKIKIHVQAKNQSGTSNFNQPLPKKRAHVHSERLSHLENISNRPRRNPLLHWIAFLLSLFSLGLAVAYVNNSFVKVTLSWVVIDIIVNAGFVFEFFTRSGFRWNPIKYTFSRFFDFVAIVPFLAIIGYGFPLESVWVWLILAARAVRALDRLLGDGFIERNTLALTEAFEEEITDRVLLRIIERTQADVERGSFTRGIAKVMRDNKDTVLQRIARETPLKGITAGIARLTGLDIALERAEEQVYDSAVNVVDSDEVDSMVRQTINSAFNTMRADIGTKQWKKHLGFGNRKNRGDEEMKETQ